MIKYDDDPTNNSFIQIFSHLDISTKYQYMTSVTILIFMDQFLDNIQMLITDAKHSPLYQMDIG